MDIVIGVLVVCGLVFFIGDIIRMAKKPKSEG